MRLLRAGTPLFHGTPAHGFDIPRGPAWFAFTHEKAAFWSAWASKAGDVRRVLAFHVTTDVELADTRTREAWEALSARYACGDTTYEMASAFERHGLPGWYGQHEIMLVNPAAVLRLVGSFVADQE